MLEPVASGRRSSPAGAHTHTILAENPSHCWSTGKTWSPTRENTDIPLMSSSTGKVVELVPRASVSRTTGGTASPPGLPPLVPCLLRPKTNPSTIADDRREGDWHLFAHYTTRLRYAEDLGTCVRTNTTLQSGTRVQRSTFEVHAP